MLYIPIILGTSHEGRQSEKAARYMLEQISRNKKVESELLDVRDYYIQATDNSEEIEPALRWKEKVTRADGFIIVSPEYNHGYPGELKLTLDLVYGEYDKKPVGICGVSGGGAAGIRVVEQLRLVAIALRMVPINSAMYFSHVKTLFDKDGTIQDPAYDRRVRGFLEELLWYAHALKTARESTEKEI